MTKTDADITQKKSSPTTTRTSTLRPFTVSNTGMRIKTKKTTIEKVRNPTIPSITSTGISHVNKVTVDSINGSENLKEETTTKKPAQEKVSTTTETTTVVDVKAKATTTTKKPFDLTSTTESQLLPDTFQRRTNIENPPKLDANLFTTAPVIDDEPWLPINPIINPPINPQPPSFDTVITKVVNVEASPDSSGQINILPRNKIRFSEPFDDSSFNREMLFHSFTNPAFTYLTPGIETLGSSHLRPYPIPVNKIVDEPDSTESITPLLTELNRNEEESADKKKSEGKNGTVSDNSADGVTGEKNQTVAPAEPTVKIGDVLLDLLGGKTEANRKEPPKETATTTSTTAAPETTTAISFKNIKEFVLLTAKNNNSSQDKEVTAPTKIPNATKATNKEPPPSTSTLRNFAENATISTKPTSYVEVETVQYTPVSENWNQPSLFPVQSKFEYVNGTLVSSFDTQTFRRIFNETLHAWIIENSHKDKVEENDDHFERKNSSHIQNISAIFDTLASELGIQPNISTKSPPFKAVGNKLKTGTYPLGQTNKPVTPSTTTTATTTTTTMKAPTEYYVPIKQDDSYGEAEIEEIDPLQYEQILMNDNRVTSTTVPSLVTLMPAKSNSGLRQQRPMIDKLKMAIKNSRGMTA